MSTSTGPTSVFFFPNCSSGCTGKILSLISSKWRQVSNKSCLVLNTPAAVEIFVGILPGSEHTCSFQIWVLLSFFLSRYGDFFFKSQKSLCWIPQPFFFGRQVAKIRQKKKHSFQRPKTQSSLTPRTCVGGGACIVVVVSFSYKETPRHSSLATEALVFSERDCYERSGSCLKASHSFYTSRLAGEKGLPRCAIRGCWPSKPFALLSRLAVCWSQSSSSSPAANEFLLHQATNFYTRIGELCALSVV
jgi:hypothetical protein